MSHLPVESLFPSPLVDVLNCRAISGVWARCSCSSLSTLSINTWSLHPLLTRSSHRTHTQLGWVLCFQALSSVFYSCYSHVNRYPGVLPCHHTKLPWKLGLLAKYHGTGDSRNFLTCLQTTCGASSVQWVVKNVLILIHTHTYVCINI